MACSPCPSVDRPINGSVVHDPDTTLSGRTAALLACRIYYGHLTFTAITQSRDICTLDSLPNGDIFGWRMWQETW
jgi:hypothetical protein